VKVEITIDSRSDEEIAWIAIDHEDPVFVSIDRDKGFIKNMSIQISKNYLFEVGPCINGNDQYPSFLISQIIDGGSVIDRIFIRKLNSEWVVEHS
jgi:hypothetical protein